MLGAADAAARMLAADQPALPVDGVAIGIAGRLAEHADAAVGLVVTQHAVVRNVGPDHITAGREPRRSLRPPASGEEFFHLRGAVEQPRETRIENFVIFSGHGSPPRSFGSIINQASRRSIWQGSMMMPLTHCAGRRAWDPPLTRYALRAMVHCNIFFLQRTNPM
jgi:hypothetical protein